MLFSQSCLVFTTPWTAERQASLSFTISQSLLKLMSIELMPFNHLFSIVAVPIYIPTNSIGRFPFLHTLSSISVRFISVAQLFPSLCNPMDCNMPGFSVNHQLLELPQTHIHRVGDGSNHLILCCPLLLLLSIFLSIRVFSNESVICIR